jgi:serine protease
MSLGGPGSSGYIEDALDSIYQRGDVLLLAAAGNDGTSAVSYPAGYRAVVSVAATGAGGSWAA